MMQRRKVRAVIGNCGFGIVPSPPHPRDLIMRNRAVVEGMDLDALRAGIEWRFQSGRVCQRVLMIANMLEGMEHEEAARLAGLSRSAAYEWHNRYEEEGMAGLRDRPRPGRQPRVDAVTSARLKERIVAGAALERDGVVAFRGVDAQRILREEFEIDCSLSSIYRLLHRMKLSCLAPRPRHPQADATAQAEFSQLLDCN
jgi:transposase